MKTKNKNKNNNGQRVLFWQKMIHFLPFSLKLLKIKAVTFLYLFAIISCWCLCLKKSSSLTDNSKATRVDLNRSSFSIHTWIMNARYRMIATRSYKTESVLHSLKYHHVSWWTTKLWLDARDGANKNNNTHAMLSKTCLLAVKLF